PLPWANPPASADAARHQRISPLFGAMPQRRLRCSAPPRPSAWREPARHNCPIGSRRAPWGPAFAQPSSRRRASRKQKPAPRVSSRRLQRLSVFAEQRHAVVLKDLIQRRFVLRNELVEIALPVLIGVTHAEPDPETHARALSVGDRRDN